MTLSEFDETSERLEARPPEDSTALDPLPIDRPVPAIVAADDDGEEKEDDAEDEESDDDLDDDDDIVRDWPPEDEDLEGFDENDFDDDFDDDFEEEIEDDEFRDAGIQFELEGDDEEE